MPLPPTAWSMLHGEIRLTDLDPTRGKEANAPAPVIVSNNQANATADRLGRGVLTIVPVTSNTSRNFPFRARREGRGSAGQPPA